MATVESGNLSAAALEGGCFQGRGGVRIGETLMGGLGFVGCGWAGGVGGCVDGELLVCLARLV